MTHTGVPTDGSIVRGVDSGCLLATIDEEIGKIGPGPKASTPTRKSRVLGTPGCGEKSRVPGDGSLSLGWKSGHTSFSPLTVDPPQPSGSASSPTPQTKTCLWGPRSGPIFARNPGSPAHDLCALGWNAIHLSSVNRP